MSRPPRCAPLRRATYARHRNPTTPPTHGGSWTFSGVDLADLDEDSIGDLTAFAGASTGLISDDDVRLTAEEIAPGSAALMIVYENRWAASFVAAVRRNGGELIAFERIHISDLIAALDAAEAAA